MKDVFKVLSKKRKSCTSQINKDILETIFTSTSTSTFSSTILVTFLELIFEPCFQKKLLFLYPFPLLPRVDPFLREWISFGGKRTSANPAGVAVHPFWFRLADLMGLPARGKSVCLVDEFVTFVLLITISDFVQNIMLRNCSCCS